MKPHLPFNFYHFIICFSTCLIIPLGKVEAGEITTISYNSQGVVEFSGNGISARVENIEINNNRKVVFKDGAALKSGGSDFLYSELSRLSICGNSSVLFDSNSALEAASIQVDEKDVFIEGNGSVVFQNNYTDIHGSAIYVSGSSQSSSAPSPLPEFSLSNNGKVLFLNNEGTTIVYVRYKSGLEMNNNDRVEFRGNKGTMIAHGYQTYSHSGLTTMIANNNSVVFAENDGRRGFYGYNINIKDNNLFEFSDNNGQEIEAEGVVSITGNRKVCFSGNYAYSADFSSIHGSDGVEIRNNDFVLFEKNFTSNEDGEYVLNYFIDTSREVRLSSAAGKKIEFRDGLYLNYGDLCLNEAYMDEGGQWYQQSGDILFTGLYTEQNLNGLLEKKGTERPATESEISKSLTTEIEGQTRLYGGRLRVEDGAVFSCHGFVAETNSGGVVLVKDATFGRERNGATFNAGTTLQVEGSSRIIGNVTMLQNSNLVFTLRDVNMDFAAMMLDSALNMQGVHVKLDGVEYLLAGEYKLIDCTEDLSGIWTEGVLNISGGDAAALTWKNGVLTYKCENMWNVAVSHGETRGDTEGNLVVTDGACISINGALTPDSQQQGKGHLIIDSGSAKLSEGGSISGDVVFSGMQEEVRELVVGTDTEVQSVVLETSANSDSSIAVEDTRELSVGTIAGVGNLVKEGAGTLKLTGNSSEVQGTIEVKEGTVLNSGNLNCNKIVVTSGYLENQGSISSIEVNGGTLSGSGVFGGLTMKAGRLVVGNSPGFQMYSEDLHAEGGELLFSVASVTDAATSSCVGWESTVYSNIDMGGNSLNIGENVTLTIAFGGETLTGLAESTMEQPLTISLQLVKNAGNHAFFTDELLARLEEQTEFIITSESEGLTAGTASLAGLSLMQYVSDVAYTYDAESGSLTLTASFATNGGLSIPEPATATLSLLALAALAARRRRK